MNNINSIHAPSAHHIQRGGIGYTGQLNNEALLKLAPSVFAPEAHSSRSGRYAYIPTLDLIDGMRDEGFLPVKVSQASTRDQDKKGFGKHLIRFRRADQLDASEAREVAISDRKHDAWDRAHAAIAKATT